MNKDWRTPGISDTARYVQDLAEQHRRHVSHSNAFRFRSLLNEELAAVWEECRTPNWDGYNAMAVSQDSLRNACRFLEALPLGLPPPSIGADPDGTLTLEWHRSARDTLSVSITADVDLHYAALIGVNRVHGTEAFFGEVPNMILYLLCRVFGSAPIQCPTMKSLHSVLDVALGHCNPFPHAAQGVTAIFAIRCIRTIRCRPSGRVCVGFCSNLFSHRTVRFRALGKTKSTPTSL